MLTDNWYWSSEANEYPITNPERHIKLEIARGKRGPTNNQFTISILAFIS